MTSRLNRFAADVSDDYWNESVISGFEFDDSAVKEAKKIAANLAKHQAQADETGSVRSGCSNEDYINIEEVTWRGDLVQRDSKKPENTASLSKPSTSLHPSYSASAFSRSKQTDVPPNLDLIPALQGVPVSPAHSASSRSSNSYQVSSLPTQAQPSSSKLEEQVKFLQRQLVNCRRDRYHPLDVKETIIRIIKGDPYSLEHYRSLEDKTKLLKAAISFCDGNAITAVTVFLKCTLNYTNFLRLLLSHPVAADHYVSYLREFGGNSEELSSVMFSLGRKEEAAMLEFRAACKRGEVSARISALKRGIQYTLSADPALSSETAIVMEYVSLLERQQPINDSDDSAIQSGKADECFKLFPKAATLVGQPVLTTLYYCCLYHYELPENSFASPLSMKMHHNLTEKQFAWIAAKALSRRQRWTDIERLLTKSTFLGNAKVKSLIPFEKLIEMLAKQKAPSDVLALYISQISDADRQLKLAIKHSCHKAAIDCYISQRDRLGLIQYASQLTAHTKDAYYAEGAVKNQNYKWKN